MITRKDLFVRKDETENLVTVSILLQLGEGFTMPKSSLDFGDRNRMQDECLRKIYARLYGDILVNLAHILPHVNATRSLEVAKIEKEISFEEFKRRINLDSIE